MIISIAGTAVVSVRASDPDGGAFTFVIQNQQPAAAVSYFTVSNTGDVTVATAPDREVIYMFCSQHVFVRRFSYYELVFIC